MRLIDSFVSLSLRFKDLLGPVTRVKKKHVVGNGQREPALWFRTKSKVAVQSTLLTRFHESSPLPWQQRPPSLSRGRRASCGRIWPAGT